MLSDIDEVSGKSSCPLCGGETAYLSTDLRPVFPQERLLLELLLDAEPLSFAKKSVWCENSRYYIGGKARSISSKTFLQADTNALSKRLEELKALNEKDEITSLFEGQIERFILANRPRLNALIEGESLPLASRSYATPSPKGACPLKIPHFQSHGFGIANAIPYL